MSSSRRDSPVPESSASHRGELKWRRNKGTPAVSPNQTDSIAISSGLESGAPSEACTKRDFRELTTSIPGKQLSDYVSRVSVCSLQPSEIVLSTPTASDNTRIQISVSPETARLASSVTNSMDPAIPLKSQTAGRGGQPKLSWAAPEQFFTPADDARTSQPSGPFNPPGTSREQNWHGQRVNLVSSQRRSEGPPVYRTPERAHIKPVVYSASTEAPSSPPSASVKESSSINGLISPIKPVPPKLSGGSSSIYPSPTKSSPDGGSLIKPCREVSRLTIGSGETAASIDASSDEQTQHGYADESRIEEREFEVPWKKGETGGSVSTLCQCPCLNCATCPLRVGSNARLKGASDCGSRKGDSDTLNGKPENSGVWQKFKDAFDRFIHLQAPEDPSRFCYDSVVIPSEPLPKPTQRLLEITELPFLILWVYLTYWCVIVSMTATTAPSTVWLSALVASLLVGIGLNANAYKSVTVPRRRGSIRHHRHARALLELKKYGESFDAVEMKLDWGMIVRFFIIPFGVSSLSGLTNSNRERFLLVFPNDLQYLLIAILCPAVVVIFLALFRVFLLWKLRVRWSLQVLFLNGALVD